MLQLLYRPRFAHRYLITQVLYEYNGSFVRKMGHSAIMGSAGGNILGILCIIFICAKYILCQGGPPPGGEVVFIVQFMSPLYPNPDEQSKKYIDTSMVEAKRMNETMSCMSGVLLLKNTFDENTMMEIVLEKEASGKLEKVMTHELCNVCAEFGNEEGDYFKFLQYFEMPEHGCPLEAGTEMKIHDMMVDTSDMPVNSANSGCYVASMNFKRSPDGTCNDEMEYLAGVKMDFCIEPI